VKPTAFLKKRFREFLKEISNTPVTYYEFLSSATKDLITGDIDESTAYSTTGLEISARVDFFPSKALRAAAGLDITFDSMLMVSSEELSEKGIVVKIGDALVLPNGSEKNYVVKVVDNKQAGLDFIGKLIFTTRTNRNRG